MVIALRSAREKSIRIQLLSSLLYPLCILWLLSTILAYYLAVSFANDSYDSALLNSAEAVAARLRFNGTDVLVDLPPAAQAILRHNNRDKFYYQVISQDGKRISGDMLLPGPFPQLDSSAPLLRFAQVNGEDVRLARIHVDFPNFTREKVLVQVAETLHSRHQLAQQILLSIIVPQIILIILGALAVWRGVSRSLQPLVLIKNNLGQRSRLDLSPVDDDVPVEVRPLVHAINDLLAKIRTDIETQKRFVANAAHQFRTPLAGLKTYIFLAKRLAADGKGSHKNIRATEDAGSNGMISVLDKIDAGTDRMSSLANKLLSLAKADPDIAEKFTQLDLNSVVSEITAELVGEAMKKSIQLEFISNRNPAIVYGDQDKLMELAENLVENAILYTQAGGRVEARLDGSSDCVSLVVEDNGPGIPEDQRQHVFERFYRILGTDVPGSGLGLAIVKEIAAKHNAEVSISSGDKGLGTLVRVRFPSAVPALKT